MRNFSLALFTVGHFLTDAAAAYLIFSVLQDRNSPERFYLATILYLTLSFALRPFIGFLSDRLPSFPISACGLGASAVGVFLIYAAPWVSLVFIGIGSALFHTGAGGRVLVLSRGYFARVAVFLSGGTLGIVAGRLLTGKVSLFFCGALFVLGAGICAVVALMSGPTKALRGYHHTDRILVNRPLTGGLLLLSLFSAAFGLCLAETQQALWFEPFLTGLLSALGLLIGGFLADRFGARRVVALSLFAAILPATVFVGLPVFRWAAVLLLSVSFSSLLCAFAALAPKSPRLLFGTASLPLFLAALLINFHPIRLFTLKLVLFLALFATAIVCWSILTDNCRMFRFTFRAIRKTQED